MLTVLVGCSGWPAVVCNANESTVLEIAPAGLRHWSKPFAPTDLWGCYVSVTPREGQLEFWNVIRNGEGPAGFNLAVWRGPDLDSLGEPTIVFGADQVHDVIDRRRPDELVSQQRFDRSHVQYVPEFGYVGLLCVNPDYSPGSVDLAPALMVAPEALTRDGVYLGKLSGEPDKILNQRLIWSDGGTLFRLPDSRWRIYMNGYGVTLSAVESERLEGPWRFLRDDEGAIQELCSDYEQITTRPGSCFPTILRVSDDEWHLWLSDQWQTQAVWHFWSRDGLEWQPYGAQPEISRRAVGGSAIKCLRAYYDPSLQKIVGLLSVWEQRDATDRWEWRLYRSTLDPGPPRN